MYKKAHHNHDRTMDVCHLERLLLYVDEIVGNETPCDVVGIGDDSIF